MTTEVKAEEIAELLRQHGWKTYRDFAEFSKDFFNTKTRSLTPEEADLVARFDRGEFPKMYKESLNEKKSGKEGET
jgi:hypothetical protein